MLERALDQCLKVGKGARQDDFARRAKLERKRRVEHVRRRQAVVDPAALVPDLRRDHVDEGGHVMTGGPFALVDRLDRERRPVVNGPGGLGRHHPLGCPGVGGGKLHLQPRLHSSLRRPDGADLLSGVTADHGHDPAGRTWTQERRRDCCYELIIRAASKPAFLAPSIATQPTGTPGGICTAESSASSPARVLPVSGTPITGRSVWAAATPRSAADIPAPAMITLSPRIRAA